MLGLYRLLFLPILVVLSPHYLRRMFRRGGYRDNFAHRFGFFPQLPPPRPGRKRVWLQAVSVGEMLAIGPLLTRLAAGGTTEVFLSTTTSTGYRLAKERYAGLTVGIGYFPLDFWPCSALAWRRINPDLAIITEGERWPEHIYQANRRGVPVLCINARLSERSFRRLQRLRPLVQPLLGGITRLLACSAHDAQRFRDLGFPAERLQTTGNLKLDLTLTPLTDDEKVRLRRELGLGPGLVLLGSSTWPGEETALVEALKAARAHGHQVSLLLVPRHAERREEIKALLEKSGLSQHFRSQGAAPGAVDVAVGDTTGELRQFTQLADLVFVGKSLPPHGEGQTPVEAAALGRPVIFGPGMSNFGEISRRLHECLAARQVLNHSELISTIVDLLGDTPARSRMSAAALAWHAANRGAIERTLAVVQEYLRQKSAGLGFKSHKTMS